MMQNSYRALTLILISILLPCNQTSCKYFLKDADLNLPENAVEQIDEVIQTLAENDQFSGVVFVSVKGRVVYKKAVGYANLEDSIPNTMDTKFRIASFTKPITAMLILQLEEDGLIKLDGKLVDYLPEYSVKSGEKITIHQLLTHTAGIIGHPRIPNLLDIEKVHYTREELLHLIMTYDLVFKPGEGYEYSNFGYALLALVIEKVSGRTFDEVMYEKICIPAGMTNTLSDISEQEITKRAVGYTYDYFDGLVEAPFLDMSFVLGAGQLISTAEDLFLFDRALYTDKLLSARAKDLFFTTYGWHPARYHYGNGYKRISCYNLEGSINGFQSHTQRIEKDTVLIVALRNVKEAVFENQIVVKWPDAIASPIISILYDEDYDLMKMSGAFVVFRTLIDSGQDQAEDRFIEIKKRKGKYYIDKEEFEFFEQELRKRNMDQQADIYSLFIREV